MSCLGGLMIAEVKYYLIVHSMLHLKLSPAQEPFMSSIFYVLKSALDRLMPFYADENINYVSCLCSSTGRTCGEPIRARRARRYNADAVHECGFTATWLIIHGGHVREK